MLTADKAAMVAVWERLTADNLQTAHIKNSDGLIVGRYAGLVPGDPVITAVHANEDGTILTTFNVRLKTELEKLAEQVTSNVEVLGIHDAAIGDMGAVLSTVEAEGGVQ